MQQVLFRVPGLDWPIYGYGMMLFLAYFFCTWLASWLAKKEGIPAHSVYDLGIFIFICGIAGARVAYMIHFEVPWSLLAFFSLWDGGLIFYGSAIGGVIGYIGAYFFILRKHKISTLKMADIIAPCAALGLCLGRIGCLLNGCCFGNVGTEVAWPEWQTISFPLAAPPRYKFVEMGYQTAAGFTFVGQSDTAIARVEPDSPAARAGLRDGDEIVAIEIDGEMKKPDPYTYLGSPQSWPRGKNEVTLKVRRGGGEQVVGPFAPLTLGLHPTQIYESISMALLFLVLMAYYPYRRHAGDVMVLFMLCYAVHRFLNEALRNDTDFIGGTHMTLSQIISIVVFAGGLLMGCWLRFARISTNAPQTTNVA